jgi:glutamate--cysteine ligase
MNASHSEFQHRAACLEQARRDYNGAPYRLGLEKEALRIAQATQTIATTPHPHAFGSPLTHPYFTTDFSEALLELVTPVLDSVPAAFDFLHRMHQFIQQRLEDEYLWAASMPCSLPAHSHIPLARYGQSHAAQMKTVYRRGLGHRYGRIMQVIAGLHFNWSLAPELWPLWQAHLGYKQDARAFRDAQYMGMVRNLQRTGWLIPYLFGASPAVCKSFIPHAVTQLQIFDEHTYYDPYATSLRLGDIGYQNHQEEGKGIKACYDDLDAYICSLTRAIQTICPDYEAIGVYVNGRYEQLNANILQIENEYYSTVRPKPNVKWMEKPTVALQRQGIQYIELRSIDVNPFEPAGINRSQLYFLTTFMLYNLLQPSLPFDQDEPRAIDHNELITAHRGREKNIKLIKNNQKISMFDWACELFTSLTMTAELLDGHQNGHHCQSVNEHFQKLTHVLQTPSEQLLESMHNRQEGFTTFIQHLSAQHQEIYRQQPLDPQDEKHFQETIEASWIQQQTIEAQDQGTFSDFLQRYFASLLSCPEE